MFHSLFANQKPLIACLHLLALPGSPFYSGQMREVYRCALEELAIYQRHNIDAVLLENFRDKPFYPGKVPAETVAALAALGREIVKEAKVPVGVNVLRNDGEAAIAIANAIEAQFVRINVHMHAVVSEEGIIQGLSHRTLRLRKYLKSDVLILADVRVKHAAPLVDRDLASEAQDLTERGFADALILTGARTGLPAQVEEVAQVKEGSQLPVLIGSGMCSENLPLFFEKADGFIVGSFFKEEGIGSRFVDERRVQNFCETLGELRKTGL